MKLIRSLLVLLEIALFTVPDLYYRAAAKTGNLAVLIVFFVINIAFIKSLDYFVKLAKNSGKPT